jgi:hypothetical protein
VLGQFHAAIVPPGVETTSTFPGAETFQLSKSGDGGTDSTVPVSNSTTSDPSAVQVLSSIVAPVSSAAMSAPGAGAGRLMATSVSSGRVRAGFSSTKYRTCASVSNCRA